MTQISPTVRSIMKQQKLTARELSERASIPLASLKSILHGKSMNPRATTLRALAGALDCDISTLVNGELPPPVEQKMLSLKEEEELLKSAIIALDNACKKLNIAHNGYDERKAECISKSIEFARERAKQSNEAPKIDPYFTEWLAKYFLAD